MKLFCTTLITTLILFANLNAELKMTTIVPQPKQAYIREDSKSSFKFRDDFHIYLNENNPQYSLALEFNREMRERGLDTLDFILINTLPDSIFGIVIGFNDSLINSLFEKIDDQKIAVTDKYPGAEGYVLDILKDQVIIAGSDERGAHYGINSFFQLYDDSEKLIGIFPYRIIDAPDFPVRWVYTPTNLQVGANVDKLKAIWKQSADLKLNGMNLTDYKWGFLTQVPDRYIDSLYSVRDYAKAEFLDIIPGVFSFGYSNSILFHNPNWASGLPVKSQQFVISADTARLVPQVNVALSNGGLESYNGNNFTGFGFIDDPGIRSFVDTDVKHSGNASIRFTDFSNPQRQGTNARLSTRKAVQPFTLYHMSAWIKTENLSSGYITQMMALGKNGQAVSLGFIDVPSTTDWKKVDITFNSLNNDTLSIYWGTWDAKTGTIWWDDLVFEEVAFINLLRRTGTPLNIGHKYLDIAYIEGVDYDSLYDAKLGRVNGYGGDYDLWHQAPTFKRNPNGSIRNGDTLIMSYYHTTVIYDSQVMCTMSDDDLYKSIETEFQILDSILKPKTYFMEHDEIRLMNWDYGDQIRGLTPGQILADNVQRCTDIIHKYNPTAKAWTWNDMFDEYHNAKPSNYYLVNGDLTGSADLLSKEIGIGNWNSSNHEQSLKFFADKGFPQISAPYYDQDENNIRIWKEWTQNTPNFLGMMYTTWASRYTHLEPFAEYSWNHAPHIYHYPKMIEPKGYLSFKVVIFRDNWDTGWDLDGATLYFRTNPEQSFTSIDFDPNIVEETAIGINLPKDNEFLQYYFTAKDNRGWTKKIPFGDSVYFELGAISVNVKDNIKNDITISPNPVQIGDKLNVINLPYPVRIEIFDCIGNEVFVVNEGQPTNSEINTSGFSAGIYFVKIYSENTIFVKKLIVY